MRLLALSVSLACLSIGTASAAPLAWTAPVKLPLQWVDRRAYTATVTINGIPQVLEVTTTTSDVWLACSLVAPNATYVETCAMKDCPVILSRAGVNVCTSQTKATIAIQDSALELDNFPVDVVLDRQNITSNPSNETPVGLLGLGVRSALFGSMYPELLSNKTIATSVGNFSLYLTNNTDGNGSFVLLGGSFEAEMDGFSPQELSDRQLSTRFSLPLRVDASTGIVEWELSLTAVRFGDDQLLYPRIYRPSEVPGNDAVASVSLGEPGIKMPPSVFAYFRQKYMALGCIVSSNGSVCDSDAFQTLPPIGLYINDKIFHLDPSDFTIRTTSQLLVLVSSSSSESRWILGAPFLRRFPAMFSLPARRIDVLCQFNVSCDSRAPGAVWTPQTLPTTASDTASDPTPSPSVTMSPMRLQYSPVVILVMGSSFGVIGIILACVSATKRWRNQNDPNIRSTDTVASDKDMEELALALQEMSSSSEVHHDEDAAFTPLPSPQRQDTARS